MAVPFNVPPGDREIAGDFHRPYEGSETVSFYHSTGDTPSCQAGDFVLQLVVHTTN